MRLTTELLDADELTTEPTMPDEGLFGDIPRAVWIGFLSAWAMLFGLFLIFFTANGRAALDVVTSSFFALMILGLPAALAGLSKTPSRPWPRTIMTRSGPLPTRVAAIQILLIPVAAVIGLALFILLAL